MKTVLLLDDDAQFRALLVPQLEARGMRVLEASKGRVARRMMLVEQPDLAIVDGLLPDTNGVHWIEEIRAARVRVPVIFVSAFFKDLASFRKLTDHLGVAQVMHKPVRPETLARVAERLCGAEVDEPYYPSGLPSGLPPETTEVGLTAPVPSPHPGEEEEIIFLPATSSFELEEDEIARAYAAQLPEVVADLQVDIEAALERSDREALEDAVGAAHQLHGTAGSFGFSAVGAHAGRLEALLRALRQEDPEADPGAVRACLEALSEVAIEARRAPASAPPSEATEPPPPPLGSFVGRPDSQWPELLGPGVLVVDPDPALLEYFRTALGERLIRLRTAATYEEAVEVAEAEAPDLAFVGMPFGAPDRSPELVEALRGIPGCEALPVAVVAIRDEMASRLAASRAGVDLFLAHPLDGRVLDRAIRRLREGRMREVLRVAILASGKGSRLPVVPPLVAAGFDVETFGSLPRLLAGTRDQAPDAVVIHAGSEGPDLCRLLRASPLGEEAAVLVLGEVDRDACLLAGADDVLGDPEHWGPVIRARAVRVRSTRAHLSFCPVTQLPRRDFAVEALASRLAAAQRHERSFTLAMVRVDGRAALVEEHGRAAGERAVAELGRLLFARFRQEDTRGRWGEDAFLLGFDEVRAEVMAPVIRRVQEEFAALVLAGGAGRRFHATFSAGLASARPMDLSLKSILVRAERRLERAALAGPNGLVSGDR